MRSRSHRAHDQALPRCGRTLRVSAPAQHALRLPLGRRRRTRRLGKLLAPISPARCEPGLRACLGSASSEPTLDRAGQPDSNQLGVIPAILDVDGLRSSWTEIGVVTIKRAKVCPVLVIVREKVRQSDAEMNACADEVASLNRLRLSHRPGHLTGVCCSRRARIDLGQPLVLSRTSSIADTVCH